MAHAKLTIEVDFDPNKTDSEGLATAFDGLLKTAMCIPGVMDEYGKVKVSKDGFLSLEEPSSNDKIVEWLDKGEFYNPKTVRALIQEAGTMLDRAEASEICGGPLFRLANGKWYRVSVEAIIEEADPEYVHEIQAEKRKRP
jgi:hypothetical protein